MIVLGIFFYGCEKKEEEVTPPESQKTKLFNISSGADYGFEIIQTSDEGFLIVGGTHSESSFLAQAEDADVLVMKLNNKLDTLWAKTYGGNDDDEGKSVVELSDGTFIVSGYSKSFGNGTKDLYLLKIDKDGNKIWEKTEAGNKDNIGEKIK